MSRGGARRAERGSTMIEVMIATTVLIVAAAGFAGMSNFAATSTGVGHRRTTGTLLRASTIDRLNVTPRAALRSIAAAAEDTWIVEACYDVDSRPTARNDAWSVTFTCPAETYYRSWIRVNDNGTAPWDRATNTWSVALYVERVDPGCTPELREASVACVPADLMLTD
ncbi:MAG TPA: prepilin-type N-terminal cleavage/methylation domain-containing protein [Anaeromyxobacteraceae bacterium]|nr:prepilin-type N-terminal cleavage/methylation domain-containing protein [Anaeromyxobacteraceae bacterium]